MANEEKDRPTKRQRNDDDVTTPSLLLTPYQQTLLSKIHPHLSPTLISSLTETVHKLTTYGKGITACDESAGTIGTRFDNVASIENTEENRRIYRQMLLETDGIEEYLSGAILDPETLYQKSTKSNELFPQSLTNRGIVPGVKPHLKVYALPGMHGDTVMQGLDSLAVRAKEYYNAGARFAKWRSPFTVDMARGRPTDVAIAANMTDLARYALICQSEGLVPIVEPDVSLVGSHTLEEAVAVNVKIHSLLYKSMLEHGVYMGGATVKTNIVNPGKDCTTKYTVDEIGQANVFFLEQCMPASIRGVNYLSGGQSLSQALGRLDAINRAAKKRGGLPFNLSFSWSQALQLPLLELCSKPGGTLKVEEMAEEYVKELKMAALAAKGELECGQSGGDHVPKE